MGPPPPITYPVSYLRILHTYRALTYNEGDGGLPASHSDLCSGRLLNVTPRVASSALNARKSSYLARSYVFSGPAM